MSQAWGLWSLDEFTNQVAFILEREPWLTVLIPIAVAALILLIWGLKKRARSSAPPGSSSTSSPLEEAPASPRGLHIYEGEMEPTGPASNQVAPPSGPHLIEVVIISDGLHKHEKIRSKDLNFTWNKYKIEEARLYAGHIGILEGLKFGFKGISHKWLILFWEGVTQAVTIPVARVDPMVLARVRTARILSRAMKEIFSTALLDKKGVIFLFIVFGVIAVIVLKVQGYL
jgi:hypothetical protein